MLSSAVLVKQVVPTRGIRLLCLFLFSYAENRQRKVPDQDSVSLGMHFQ